MCVCVCVYLLFANLGYWYERNKLDYIKFISLIKKELKTFNLKKINEVHLFPTEKFQVIDCIFQNK